MNKKYYIMWLISLISFLIFILCGFLGIRYYQNYPKRLSEKYLQKNSTILNLTTNETGKAVIDYVQQAEKQMNQFKGH